MSIQQRDLYIVEVLKQDGKPAYVIRCPFCDNRATVLRYALATTGHACECGARIDKDGSRKKHADN